MTSDEKAFLDANAAATGDPTMLIDWFLENARGGRPWLEAALRAACVEAA